MRHERRGGIGRVGGGGAIGKIYRGESVVQDEVVGDIKEACP